MIQGACHAARTRYLFARLVHHVARCCMLGFAKASLLASLTREPDLAYALTAGTRARSSLLLLRWRRGDYTTDCMCASQPGRYYVGKVCIYPYCRCDATSCVTPLQFCSASTHAACTTRSRACAADAHAHTNAHTVHFSSTKLTVHEPSHVLAPQHVHTRPRASRTHARANHRSARANHRTSRTP